MKSKPIAVLCSILLLLTASLLSRPCVSYYPDAFDSVDLPESADVVGGIPADKVAEAFQEKYGHALDPNEVAAAVVAEYPSGRREVCFLIPHAELDIEDVRSGANVVWASSLSQQTVSFRNGRLIENGTELLFDNVTAELTADGNISFRGGLENGEVSETSLRYTPASAAIELSFSIPVGCGNDSLEENSNVAVTVTWYYDLSCLGQSLSKGVISADDSCIANLVFH